MNPKGSFQRKIIYLVAIVVLLTLLSLLGRPATTGTDRVKGSPGGVLAELRTEHGLHQTRLGEIDPTSETLKLATFGMRGLAANILWEKANEYKKKKDWTNLRAAVNQITKLEPNFVSVWIFHAWNQSHNISVEFEDVRQRYRWVINGIEFLKEGARYNDREPRLLWETGWVISHKIGRADERRQYRNFFKKDDDYHGSRPIAKRDNWLVAKDWFREAERIVDTYNVRMKGQGPLSYRSKAAMCQMSYAEALENDGTFGEVARREWKRAEDEWYEFGKVDIPTGIGRIQTVRLNELEAREKEAEELVQELEALQPEARQEIYQKKLKGLTDGQREALEVAPEKRNPQQHALAAAAQPLIVILPKEIARQITGPKRAEADKLADKAEENMLIAESIRRSRQVVNFDYWRLRAQVEQDDDTLKARELLYDGDQAFLDARLLLAKQKYEEGLAAWRNVLDRFPKILENPTFGRDMKTLIEDYRKILDKCEEPFPDDFILQDVVDLDLGEF